MRLGEAVAKAGAGNIARKRVENQGIAMLGDAINLGNNLPSQAATGYGGALTAGNAGVGNMNSTVGSGVNNLTAGNGYMNTALSGIGGAANTVNAGYANELSEFNSGFGIGDALGLITGGITSYAGAGGTFAECGAVDYEEGGAVIGPGGPKDDAIPAQLSNGEFVIPAETLQWKGEEFFEKTISKSAQDKAEATQVRMQKQGVPMQAPTPALPAPGAI